MERFEVGDAEIEYEVMGDGEPVLFVQVGLVADGLARPLFGRPELAAQYRLIHYHRRGYMGSTPGSEPPTVARQAGDAAALLRHLGVSCAHVVGHSIGGAIALQLAVDWPEVVHSLALLEAAVSGDPSRQADQARMLQPVLEAYRAGDKRKAVGLFGDAVFGSNWQPIVERAVPGGAEQAVKDMDAFMRDVAYLREWPFGPKEAEAIRQPVLAMVGTRSTDYMKEGRAMLHAWMPQIEDADVPTNHLLQMEDPQAVAKALAGFFARHPMSSAELQLSQPSSRRQSR